MGSKGSQTVNQNQTYTPNPVAGQAITGALANTANVAQTPFQTPVAPVAGFSGDQGYGFQQMRDAVGSAQPYLQQAAGYFSPSGISQFFNPYASSVLAGMKDVFGQQMAQTTGNLTQQAGGTGADRIAVGQANLARQQDLATGQTMSDVYSRAAQEAQGAGFGMGSIGPAIQNMMQQGAQGVLGTGSLQQQLAQAQMNAPYQNILQRIMWPYQNAQFWNQGVSALAPGLGGTTAGQTTYPGASPWGTIAGVGMAGLGAYGGAGGFNGWGGGVAADPYNNADTDPSLIGQRGGRVQGYADGGEVDDNPDDLGGTVSTHPMDEGVNAGALIPHGQLTPIKPNIPQLPQPQKGGGGGGKGGDTSSWLSAATTAAKLGMMFAKRGGRVQGYADGGAPQMSQSLMQLTPSTAPLPPMAGGPTGMGNPNPPSLPSPWTGGGLGPNPGWGGTGDTGLGPNPGWGKPFQPGSPAGNSNFNATGFGIDPNSGWGGAGSQLPNTNVTGVGNPTSPPLPSQPPQMGQPQIGQPAPAPQSNPFGGFMGGWHGPQGIDALAQFAGRMQNQGQGHGMPSWLMSMLGGGGQKGGGGMHGGMPWWQHHQGVNPGGGQPQQTMADGGEVDSGDMPNSLMSMLRHRMPGGAGGGIGTGGLMSMLGSGMPGGLISAFGKAEGGEVDDGQPSEPQAGPYSSLPPESQARQDEAYNTSLDRLKQLGKDVFFAPANFLKAPPWEQAAGLIGGMKAPRWTPAQDVALSKYIKGDALAIPDELAGHTETALQKRARDQGLVELKDKYKRQPGDAVKPAPPALEPDYLVNLAAEPRAALLFLERAAQVGGPGGRQAKAILNQYVQTAPTKRDALLQGYMDRLQKAGWKPGMKRGGGSTNPYYADGGAPDYEDNNPWTPELNDRFNASADPYPGEDPRSPQYQMPGAWNGERKVTDAKNFPPQDDDSLPETAEPVAWSGRRSAGALPPPTGGGGSNPYGEGREKSFMDGPWGALMMAGLGTLAASGQRDARGLPTPPLAAIGQGGMQGLGMLQKQRENAQKQQTVDQGAERLRQQAELHRQQMAKPFVGPMDERGVQSMWQYDQKTGEYGPVSPHNKGPSAPAPAVTPPATRAASLDDGILPAHAQLVQSGPYDYTQTAPYIEKGMEPPEPQSVAGKSTRALQTDAEYYLQTGKLPPVRSGRSPVAIAQQHYRDAVQNYGNAVAQSRGVAPEQMADMWRSAPGMLRFVLGPDGRSTVALGTAVRHLDTMRELAKAWAANDMPAVNRLRAVVAREFGSNAATNLEAAGRIVGPEIIKAIGVAGAGTADERHAAALAFGTAATPEQMVGAIETTQKLLGGQLEGRKRQAASAGVSEERFKSLIGERPYELLSGADKTVAPAAAAPAGAPAGAKQGNDGKWYVPDPKRPGKYLEVRP